MTHSIARADRHIQENAGQTNPLFRPKYHLSPPVGWINDPNGFGYCMGKWHLFCQFYPYDAIWGPMHWGHFTSSDLVHWQWEGTALAPDSPFDDRGCFSGTAFEQDGTMFLMYTGVHADTDGTVIQEQCLAESRDGLVFTKPKNNPVITKEMLPEGADRVDFRDPKILSDHRGLRCLVAVRGEDSGWLLLYKGQDMATWQYEGLLMKGISDMPECPDYFHLDGKDVLLTCLMNQPPDGLRFQNGHHDVVYMVGEERNGQFVQQCLHSVDLGQDFYAPQTALAPDGRRLMVAWMQMWGEAPPTSYLKHGWQGQMTYPRHIWLKEGRLYQRPIAEIKQLYTDTRTLSGVEVKGVQSFPDIQGRHVHLTCTLSNIKDAAALHLMQEGNEYAALTYDPESGVLSLDRSRLAYPVLAQPGGEAHDVARVQLTKGLSTLQLELLVDTCSIEVFALGGAAALTSLCFPSEKAQGIRFAGDYTIEELTLHTLA